MSTIREYTIALRDHIIITVCIKIDREFIARAANRIINEPLSAINAARRMSSSATTTDATLCDQSVIN